MRIRRGETASPTYPSNRLESPVSELGGKHVSPWGGHLLLLLLVSLLILITITISITIMIIIIIIINHIPLGAVGGAACGARSAGRRGSLGSEADSRRAPAAGGVGHTYIYIYIYIYGDI